MTSAKIDSVFRTRSLGTAASGITDQYADGKAAKIWQLYIGDKSQRTVHYKNFLVDLLKAKGCRRVIDVACGNGVDSMMLLEEGFEVVSVDASDKMLKQAYKQRWDHRKEDIYDKWVIEEANWLTLPEDIPELIGDGFDALICMGNSFAHLPDFGGEQQDHQRAIDNFFKVIKPGGILIIDHRNYDFILDHGYASQKNIYYNSKHIKDIKTSVLFVNNQPNLVTLDYEMDVSDVYPELEDSYNHFRLSYYPHRLASFKRLLKRTFGSCAEHCVFADFKSLSEEPNPAFYIHVIEKLK